MLRGWRFRIVVLFLFIIVVIAAGLYVRNEYRKFNLARSAVEDIEKLRKEQEQCIAVLSQTSGEFAEYEYCRQLLIKFPKK